MPATLKQLENNLQELKTSYQELPTEDLQQKVLSAYRQKTIGQLEILFQDKSDTFLKGLQTFLANNQWAMINEGWLLAYTASPEEGLTVLLCDIAEFVAAQLNDSEISAISLLLPNVALESLSDDYPSLNEVDLKWVLKNHILGREGLYLIPVKQFINLHDKPENEWFNVYFSTAFKNDMAFLSKEEFERLSKHSNDTELLSQAYTDYETSSKKEDNLLTHLRQLSRNLYFNSYKGVGTHEQAGLGAYNALIQFNEYYQTLTEEVKAVIPANVKAEIDLLLALASDSTKNLNANDHEDIKTCVAVRRDKLDKEMRTCEEALIRIGLTQEDKVKHIEHLKKRYLDKKQELLTTMNNQAYSGQDKLGLSLKLMDSLGVVCTIASQRDLSNFMKLSAAEITDLCQDEAIQQQIINQFVTLEHLVLFTLDASAEKLAALLNVIGPKLANKLLATSYDLSTLLVLIDDERSDVICNAMTARIQQLVNSSFDFRIVFEILSPSQSKCVYGFIKNRVPEILSSSTEFDRTFEGLFRDGRTALYEAMQGQFTEIIQSAMHLKTVFSFLTEEQCKEVLKEIKPQLPKLINSVAMFQQICAYLPYEKSEVLFNEIKSFLPEIIKTPSEYVCVNNYLGAVGKSELSEMMKDKLGDLVKDATDLGVLLSRLSLEEWNLVFAQVGARLPQILSSTANLADALANLDGTQYKDFFARITVQIPRLISTASDFGQILQSIKLHQCQFFIKEMPDFIKTVSDLASVLKVLDAKKFKFACTEFKSTFLRLIKTASDLSQLLQHVQPEQRDELIELLKEQLPQIITNVTDLNQVVRTLNFHEVSIVNMLVKGTTAEFIHSGTDAGKLLKGLDRGQFEELFTTLKYRIDTLCLANTTELGALLQQLDLESSMTSFTAILQHCLFHVSSARDLCKVLKPLNTNQTKLLLEQLHTKLPDLIIDQYSLRLVTELFLDERRALILSAVKAAIPSLNIKEETNLPEEPAPIKVEEKLDESTSNSAELDPQYTAFKALLEEIHIKSKQFDTAHFEKAKQAADQLYEDLHTAGINYFENKGQYADFNKSCTDAITLAGNELNNHRGWSEFFAQLTLAIISFGIIPLALSINSKINTGSWSYRLLKTDSEKRLDRLTFFVGQCKPEINEPEMVSDRELVL